MASASHRSQEPPVGDKKPLSADLLKKMDVYTHLNRVIKVHDLNTSNTYADMG